MKGLFTLICLCTYPLSADVGRDLTQFFNKLGGIK